MTTCDLCTKPCPRYNEIKNLAEGRMFAMKELSNLCKKIENGTLVEVVRCKDCKHRIVNEHYGEKGYIKVKAYCELDAGDIFSLGRCAEHDDWFCADGKHKGGDE